MKFFAFALLIAAVAAEDVARNARSVIGWGGVHGLGLGLAPVAAPIAVAHAPVAVAASPVAVTAAAATIPVGLGHGSWVHGIHRRSVIGAHGLAVPAVVGHGLAPAVIGHGLAPAVVSHAVVSPVVASPWGHGLIRHGRSIVGAPVIGSHGWVGAHGLVAAPVAAVPVGHGLVGHGLVGHGLVGHGLVGHGIPIHG